MFKKIIKIIKTNSLTSITAAVILAVILSLWFFVVYKDRLISERTPEPFPLQSPRTDVFSSPPEISSVEELFKADPGPDASPEDKVDFTFLVSKEAVAASSVNISGCVSEPAVVKRLTGKNLLFRNSDNQPHKLSGPDWDIEVPANDSLTFDVTSSGVHRYSCDDKPAGIIFTPY